MITEIALDYAGTEGLDEQTLRFLYQWGKSSKDVPLLVTLAGRDDLPADVQADLVDIPMAPVVTARLTRAGVTEAELIKAGSDKRVSVQVAVASAGLLPDAVYQTLLTKASSPKALVAMAANKVVGLDWRIKAAAAAAGHPKYSTMPGALTYQFGRVLEELLIADSKTGRAVWDAKPAFHIVGNLAAATTTPADVCAEICEWVLKDLEAVDWEAMAANAANINAWNSPVRQHERKLTLVQSTAAFDDIPDDLFARAVALMHRVDKAAGNSGAGKRTSTLQSRHHSVSRSTVEPAKPDNIDALVVSTNDLNRRFELCDIDNLSDEQFVRVVREATSMYHLTFYDRADEKYVHGLLEAARGNPLRTAAVLSRLILPGQYLEDLGCDAEEVLQHMSGFYHEDVGNQKSPYPWMAATHKLALMHVAHSIGTAEVISAAPVEIATWCTEPTPGSYSTTCCDEGRKLTRMRIMSYLWDRLGPRTEAWQTFESLGSKLPANMGEAVDTVLASLD